MLAAEEEEIRFLRSWQSYRGDALEILRSDTRCASVPMEQQ